jgi:copper(I)-binding protein
MTNKFFTGLAVLLSLLSVVLSGAASAHSYRVGAILVDHPWAPASLPGTTAGAAFMKITNMGPTPVVLLGASTPAAGRVEIHSMSMDGGVMRMRPMASIPIPPNGTIVFGPSGLHMMLVGLAKPLEAETMVPMTLGFQGGPNVAVDLSVESSPMGGMQHH